MKQQRLFTLLDLDVVHIDLILFALLEDLVANFFFKWGYFMSYMLYIATLTIAH